MPRLPILFGFLLVLAGCADDDGGSLLTEQTAAGVAVTASTAKGGAGQADDDATASTAGGGESVPADDAPRITGAAMLEELRSRCGAGDFPLCDILFQASDFGSELEDFGDSCGGLDPSGDGFCADQFDVTYDLGQLRGDCGEGDMVGCDLLYLYSPSGSVDEAFGDECGGIGEGANRTCVVSWGFTVDAG